VLNTPPAGEPNDRTFDDFASGHSFDVFESPMHVADLGVKLEHVMFAVVLRATSRTFLLVRFSRQTVYVFVYRFNEIEDSGVASLIE
jgi:hypothetical protein